MATAVTLAEVARRAEVSTSTVSRVLGGAGSVSPATAARVARIAAELGYVPSDRAARPARRRSRTLGVLAPPLTWPWTGEVLRGALDAADGAGYGLMIFTGSRAAQSVRRFASAAAARPLGGLLAIEPQCPPGFLADLQRGGLPVVVIQDRGGETPFPTVGTDNVGAAYAAARHLLRLGRTRPIVVTGPTGLECTRQRLTGFADVYAAAGLALAPWRVVECDFTFDGGLRTVTSLLRTLRHPGGPDPGFDALFAHNDLSAAGAVRALHDAGVRVPQDVAVVGFDDIAEAALTDPPLTTVRQPLGEMGGAAARLLMALAEGGPSRAADAPITLPYSLVVRASSAAAARAPARPG